MLEFLYALKENNLIYQSVGFVALFLVIARFQVANFKKVLRIGAFGNGFFAIQMLMIGNVPAAVACFSGFLRPILLSMDCFMRYKSLIGWGAMICVIAIGLYVEGLSWKTTIVFFTIPVVIAEIKGCGVFYRRAMLVSNVAWLVYSISTGSIGLFISSILVCVSSVISILRYEYPHLWDAGVGCAQHLVPSALKAPSSSNAPAAAE